METHKNTDNGLKFSCKVCGAQYVRGFALKDHIRAAHPGHENDEIEESYIISEVDDINEDSELYSVVMIPDESVAEIETVIDD